MSDTDGETIARLRKAGLRPTRQRRELAQLLFAECTEAVTAESLHAFALKSGIRVSLATVYGTLHSLCDVGMVREVSIDSRRYFDTNTGNRQYFYFEDERRLVAVPQSESGFTDMPLPPAGRKVSRVDVVVRLQRD
jgi:Fur family transcriptional regulator, iron response regulator